jgi:hypothetical protein
MIAFQRLQRPLQTFPDAPPSATLETHPSATLERVEYVALLEAVGPHRRGTIPHRTMQGSVSDKNSSYTYSIPLGFWNCP